MCSFLKLVFAATIKTDIIYALFTLYDLVYEVLLLTEYSIREITGRALVELLFTSFFLYVLLIKYYSCDQIMKNEMGGARGTYGRHGKCVQAFDGDVLGKESIWKN